MEAVERGLEQHLCVELQSKTSPCASSPYFITEASYIWRFRSLGGTETLTAATREHPRAPPAFRLLSCSSDPAKQKQGALAGKRHSRYLTTHQLTGSTGLPRWVMRGFSPSLAHRQGVSERERLGLGSKTQKLHQNAVQENQPKNSPVLAVSPQSSPASPSLALKSQGHRGCSTAWARVWRGCQ